MVPFFVESKGGKCAAFSFPTPIQTFPGGKALSLRAEAPKGACGSGGVLLFGRRCVLGYFLGALLRTAAGWRLAAGRRVLPLSVLLRRQRFALFGAVVEVCFCRWPLYSVCGLDCVSVPLPQRQ